MTEIADQMEYGRKVNQKFFSTISNDFKEDKSLRSIPICIITGKPELRKLIYEHPLGPPAGYMDKPITEEGLVRNLKRILEIGHHDRVKS